MKFLRLDMLAYGHFAKRSLEFPASGPNLHLIHGPNEAGKSTTLRAITGFLYGIDRLTTDAHRFEGSELRVGAHVQLASGRERYFVRRKGGSGTLLDGDGNVLDDSQLGDWLSVRDRKLFEAMFGLSHEQLRRAGEALASSKNAAAEALFGAVLEGATLRMTMHRLQEEADAILSPTGRAGELAKAVRGYRDLLEAEKKARAPLSKWASLQGEIKAAEEAEQLLGEQIRSARVEAGRLARIQRTLPWLRRRADALSERAALGVVKVLAPTVTEDRRSLLRERDDARVTVEDVAAKITRARDERETIDAPEALVAFAPRVKALNEALGTYRKAVGDIPGLVHEILPLRREAQEILRELGQPDLPLEQAESLRIPLSDQERILTLQKQCVTLSAQREQTGVQAAEAEAERARRAKVLTELASPRDVTPLRMIWERCVADHTIDDALRAAHIECDDLLREMAKCTSPLGLDASVAAHLMEAQVPSAETIRRAEDEEAEDLRKHALLSERKQRICAEQASAERLLQECTGGLPIPSVEQLQQARGRRDAAWGEVRRVWTTGVNPFEVGETCGPSPAEAFTEAMRMADAIADSLWSDADRVARCTQLLRACEEQRSRAHAIEKELEAHTAHQTQRAAAWKKRWEAVGIDPGTPREMATWRSRWDARVAVSVRQEVAAAKAAHLLEREGELRHALVDALAIADVPCNASIPWLELRVRVENTLAEASQAHQEEASLRAELERLGSTVTRVNALQAELEQRLLVWRGAWADATAKIRSQGDLEPDAVPHIFARLTRLFKVLEERERLEKRIDAMRRDGARFERELDERLAHAGLALEGHAVDRADVLIERVEAAVRASQRRASLDEQIARLEVELDAARGRNERADRGLLRLVEEQGCESLEALEEAECLSMTARSFEERCAEAERHLQALGEGWPLQELEAAAAGLDSDQIRAAIDALEGELRTKEETRADAHRRWGEAKGRKDLYTAGDEAASQLQAVKSQAEKARALGGRCARLHVASTLLQRAMTRYQEESQSVVLRRAETLFAKLTRGRYTRLLVDYDGDVATIRCVRDGEAVQVKDRVMSDGTLDQLYLALRLASIEQHLDTQEPMPLVLDDIFIHFDDARAQVGIEVLAEFATRTQVLLLTHHERNLELARRALHTGTWSELHLG